MTTGPRGERVTYPERLAEIMTRHRAESVVGRAMASARPSIEQARSRVEQGTEL
ncbi:MAG: hypothetical protein ACRDRG_07790 [Pseudonocardiaceae bacterium]